MANKYISTTALSKELQLPAKDVFSLLAEKGFVIRNDNNWILTEKGRENGGVVKNHHQYGSYIAWNEDFKNNSLFNTLEEDKNLLNTTDIANSFGVSKFRINPILSELGLLEKGIKGWTITQLGKSIGGKQFEYDKTGVPYVCWNNNILTNKHLLDSIGNLKGDQTPEAIQNKLEDQLTSKGFRDKFEAKHRSADGHYVRSRAEMLIDNWLYMSEIVHAYERKLPVEEEVYCDFYLPVGKVYIEFWGMENDSKYLARKQDKLKIYEKYGFNLIELNDEDIKNLDDVLPKKLLKFGIQTY